MFLELSRSAERQCGGWRFKTYLLKDPKFKTYFREQFQHFITENNTPEIKPHLLWDTVKAFIGGSLYQALKCLELETQL